MAKEEIKLMDIAEFRDAGYLQELNRQFLHPLGLALAVERDKEDGSCILHSIWDYRDDPEGMMYDPDELNSPDGQAKAERVLTEWEEKAEVRDENLGFVIQPIANSRAARLGFVIQPPCGEEP